MEQSTLFKSYKKIIFMGLLALVFQAPTMRAMDESAGWSLLAKTAIGMGAVGLTYCGVKLKQYFTSKNRKEHFEQARIAYYNKLKALPWGGYAEQVINQLNEEEAKLLLELSEIITAHKGIPVSVEDLIAHMNRKVAQVESFLKRILQPCAVHFLFRNKTLNWEIQKDMIHELLRECFIDPIMVKLILLGGATAERMTSPLLTSADTILIADIFLTGEMFDGKFFGNEIKAFKAQVLHEIMHLLHNDALAREAIQEITPATTECQEKVAEIERFREKRADILAGLSDPELAHALCNVCYEVSKAQEKDIKQARQLADLLRRDPTLTDDPTLIDDLTKPIDASTHPLEHVRAEYMHELHKNICELGRFEYRNPKRTPKKKPEDYISSLSKKTN